MNIKNKLLFFLIIAISQIASAKINVGTPLSSLFQTAKDSNKYVFIKIYSPDCHHCKDLEKILSNDSVSKVFNQLFVSYYLDYINLSQENNFFLDSIHLKVSGVPLMLFFDQNKNLVFTDNPTPNTKELIKVAQKAISPKYQHSFYLDKYQKGDKSIATLYHMSLWEQQMSRDSLLDTLATDMYQTLKDKDSLGTRKSFLILSRCVADIDNGLYIYWRQHSDSAFLKSLKISQKEYNETLIQIVNKMSEPSKKKDMTLEKIQRYKNEISFLNMSKTPENFIWEEEISALLKAKRNKEALVIAEQMLKNQEYQPNTCNYFMLRFIQLFSTKKDIKTIESWIPLLEKNAKTDYDKRIIKNLKDAIKNKFK